MMYRRRPRTKRKDTLEWQIGVVCLMFVCMVGARTLWPVDTPTGAETTNKVTDHVSQRRLLQIITEPDYSENVSFYFLFNELEANNSLNGSTAETPLCTRPAFLEFPPDVFSKEQRRQGAILLHALIVVYTFIALAIVCDDYFVASLDRICEKLGLGEDVAGATFMAAGSSAPEFFTSLIGVFVAKGDVGVGTIVGSAVFNILFVIGMCGLLITQVVTLNWWPLTRDSVFYSLSVLVLILSIRDFYVSWVESVIMMSLYVIYIIIMKFNPKIQEWTKSKWTGPSALRKRAAAETSQTILPPVGERKYYGGAYASEKTEDGVEQFYDEDSPPAYNGTHIPLAPVTTDEEPSHRHEDHERIPADEYYGHVRTSFHTFMFRCVLHTTVRDKRWPGSWRSAARVITLTEQEVEKVQSQGLLQLPPTHYGDPEDPKEVKQKIHKALSLDQPEEDEQPFYIPPSKSDGAWAWAKWVFCLPLCCIMFVTIPDCRKARWENWYMLTFFMAMFWIVVFSYIMVWMVTLIGYTLGVPDSIMGITFLAAGTSVPDCIASVMVAKQGLGDMAISNTIGSNIFDVLICLAFPWFLKSGVIFPGTLVHINSNGLLIESILLFTTVLITIATVHCVGWILNKKLGIICMVTYAIFIVFACLIEFNIFGYVNPPMCTD